jgi:hypothetical protein
MLMNVCFLDMHLLCICCACDFRVSKLKSERRGNEFQLFLYLSQEIPAKCAVEFIRKECVDEGSVVELLILLVQG